MPPCGDYRILCTIHFGQADHFVKKKKKKKEKKTYKIV
jgi:hypothetical protein